MNRTIVIKNIDRAETGASQPDSAWKGLYRVGAVCLLIAGPLYILGAVLSIIIGPAPSASKAYLQSVGTHVRLSQVNFGLFALADFLLIPAVVALYHSLKHIAKTTMLVAAGLIILCAILDLAVTEQNSFTLVTLTQQYTTAGSDSQRAAITGAATFALANLPLATFYSYVIAAIGYLLAGIVMLKGVYTRLTAIAGIVMGTLGILGGCYIFLPILSLFLTPCLLAFGAWALLAGARLYRLSRVLEAATISVPAAVS